MKSRKAILILTLLASFSSTIFTYFFYTNWNFIVLTLEMKGSIIALSMNIIRTGILIAITIYLLYRWLQQEISLFSDLPFLMALFVFLLVFGNFFDLFYNFIYYHYSNKSLLILLKVRFFYVIINFFPLYLVTTDLWLYSLSFRNRKILWIIKLNTSRLEDNDFRSSIRNILILAQSLIEVPIILVASSILLISSLIAVFTIPALILVAWLFYNAYKLEKLKRKCNPLIIKNAL